MDMAAVQEGENKVRWQFDGPLTERREGTEGGVERERVGERAHSEGDLHVEIVVCTRD